MTDCITAEEYKPENVEHMERDAGYKAPSLSLSLSLHPPPHSLFFFFHQETDSAHFQLARAKLSSLITLH